jgi:hypothetical protein
MFDKETSYQFYEWDAGTGRWAYRREKKPLLMIKTRPVEGKFIHRIGRAPTDKERDWDYHISLAFSGEIHRFDLLDSAKGVELGKAAYNRLRERFNGKEVRLEGHMHSSTFIVDGIEMEDGKVIGIPDEVIMLHNTGEYCNRPIHVSM